MSITHILIGANVVVFLIMAGPLGGGWFDVTDITPYIRYGASNAAATTNGQWWRLVTCMFLHYGVVHLALNMWALFQSGHLVERLLGRALFTLTYFGAGISGSLLSLVWHGDKTWSVGASGAIFGVYGALLGYMLREKHALPPQVYRPLLKSTLMFAGYNLVFGLVQPAIDNAAHVGGLVSGILFGWISALPMDADIRKALAPRRLVLALLALGIIVAAGVAAAPRYPYVVQDELAWESALKDFQLQEPELVAQENAQLRRWRTQGDNADDFIRLIEKVVAPAYADLEKKITALPLTPDRLTDRRRRRMVEYLNLKAESFGHLERAVRDGSEAEMKLCSDSEARASDVIQSLKDLKH